MSSEFSRIMPLNTATISKTPAYANNAQVQPQTAAQPAASSPMDAYGYPQKKKSHWFLKTLAAVVVLGGTAAVLRKKVDVFKNFDLASPLKEGANFTEKAKYYGTKAVAYVGEQINKGVDAFLKLFKSTKEKGSTAPAAPAATEGAATAAEGAATVAEGAAAAAK